MWDLFCGSGSCSRVAIGVVIAVAVAVVVGVVAVVGVFWEMVLDKAWGCYGAYMLEMRGGFIRIRVFLSASSRDATGQLVPMLR